MKFLDINNIVFDVYMLEFLFFLAKVILNNRNNSNYCDNYFAFFFFNLFLNIFFFFENLKNLIKNNHGFKFQKFKTIHLIKFNLKLKTFIFIKINFFCFFLNFKLKKTK